MFYQPKEIPKHKEKLSTLSSDPERIKRYKQKSLEMWETAINADPAMITLVEETDLTTSLVQVAVDSVLFDSSRSWANEHQISMFDDLKLDHFTLTNITTLHDKGFDVGKLITSKVPKNLFNQQMADIISSGTSCNRHEGLINYPDLLKKNIARNLSSIYYYNELQALPKDVILFALSNNQEYKNSSGSWGNDVGHSEYTGYPACAKIIKEQCINDSAFLDDIARIGYLFLLDKEHHTPSRLLCAAEHDKFCTRYLYSRNDSIISHFEPYWTPANIIRFVTTNKGALKEVNSIQKYLKNIDRYVFNDIQKKAVSFDILNILDVNDDFDISDQMLCIFAKEHPLSINEVSKCDITDKHLLLAIEVNPESVLGLSHRRENSALFIEKAFSTKPTFLNDIALSNANKVLLKRHLTASIATHIATHSPQLYATIVTSKYFVESEVLHVIKVCSGSISALLENAHLQKEPYISQAALFHPEEFIKWANHRGQGFIMSGLKLNTKRLQNAVDNNPELIRTIARFASIQDIISISKGLNEFALVSAA